MPLKWICRIRREDTFNVYRICGTADLKVRGRARYRALGIRDVLS